MKRKSHPGVGQLRAAMEIFSPSPGKKGRTRFRALRPRSESGVALVITLILLSVITFMAVTFLVISRHESAQVDTLSQQANAKGANDSGNEYAKALIISRMLAATNGLKDWGLIVSTNLTTNFYNGSTNITDVSYYDSNGKPLTGLALESSLNNLLVLPRPPVFVFANKNQKTPPDFRFWLDLNRNGVYDTNGLVLEQDASGTTVANSYIGDPEWIGILNHPEQRHSSSNLFLGRFAFIALPIGNSLDINYIHNQAKLLTVKTDNGFLRNQGVGSWELNLAAFLHELNTNWDNGLGITPNAYRYQTSLTSPSQGTTFDFATAILQYRYAGDYHNLRPFRTLYGGAPAGNLYASDYIDGYTHGPLMTGLTPLTIDPDVSFLKSPWSGDYSTNQYFNTQDLFNVVPNVNSSFTNQLTTVGTSYGSLFNTYADSVTNSYNRYTFYRLLSQMSFGSAPEPPTYPFAQSVNPNYFSAYGLNTPKMNLNYVNVGGISETNFIQWTPVQFFTNAADRMLRAYFPNAIGVTNDAKGIKHPAYLSLNYIPVYPTNYYTPAVHRVLQLAANMYDAINTNRIYDNLSSNGFPSVFRPIFYKDTKASPGVTTIYISGYQEVSNNVDLSLPKDFRNALDVNKFPNNSFLPPINVYGIPYVIGARQGFPSFNKFSSMPTIKMARKLEIDKHGAVRDTTQWTTNVQYSVGVTNLFAVECWYPSTNTAYSRPVTIYATDQCDWSLTNDVGAAVQASTNNPNNPTVVSALVNPIYPANSWPGSPRMFTGSPNDVQTLSFRQPFASNVVICPESPLVMTTPAQIVLPGQAIPSPLLRPLTTLGTNGYREPHFGFNVTNRIRLVMVDSDGKGGGTGRIIDYVLLGGYGSTTSIDTTNNVSLDLFNLDSKLPNTEAVYRFWSDPRGYINQIQASLPQNANPPREVWTGVPLPPYTSLTAAAQGFNTFLAQSNGTMQVPIVATRTYYTLNTWAANDPLVHYMASDLSDLVHTNLTDVYPIGGGFPLTNDFGRVYSGRYQPWGTNNTSLTNVQANEIAYKDPLFMYPEATQYPTNKFPNIGWLGRVHRGTPWQTVYLKSTIATNDWQKWTGNPLPNDAQISQPQNDWLLMDLFTTSPNDNADKGQLSVNQANYAAWAAALGGLITVSNTVTATNTSIVPWVIDPSVNLNFANNTQTNTVEYLVNCINATRANFPGGVFSSLGQICAVPQLTVQSPFLNLKNTPSKANAGINDEVYERIPQQLLSLLRLGTPRYVIFAYGQSLKPADHSIVTSGPFFGMCTNYQITGEVATRMVVRIDNYPVPGQPIGQFQPRAVVESFTVLGPD